MAALRAQLLGQSDVPTPAGRSGAFLPLLAADNYDDLLSDEDSADPTQSVPPQETAATSEE
ncbi:hypothetical protein DIPPA_18160 [Diplonema papillatum]|nr:hypothetical protein DIPPA_18160 [Diplonema papillatum]